MIIILYITCFLLPEHISQLSDISYARFFPNFFVVLFCFFFVFCLFLFVLTVLFLSRIHLPIIFTLYTFLFCRFYLLQWLLFFAVDDVFRDECLN